MTIELPEKLEAALKAQANAHGVSPAGYVCEVLERELASTVEEQSSSAPFKTGRGMFAKYGRRHPPRKSTLTAPICSAAFAKTIDDRWRCDTHAALLHLFDQRAPDIRLPFRQ
jgi:hypothetical protein